MSDAEASATHQSPPDDWAALLTGDEWRVAVRALGFDRLRELRSMMSEFTPTFRRAVIRHLSNLDGYDPGRKALLAIARSAHELRRENCPCGREITG